MVLAGLGPVLNDTIDLQFVLDLKFVAVRWFLKWEQHETRPRHIRPNSHFQFSAGYAADVGLSLDVGRKVSQDAVTRTQTLVLPAADTIEF